jgi:hypothetical protein
MSQFEIDEAVASMRSGNAIATGSGMIVAGGGSRMADAVVRRVTIDEMHAILHGPMPSVPTIYVGVLTGGRHKSFVIGLGPDTRNAMFTDMMLSM